MVLRIWGLCLYRYAVAPRSGTPSQWRAHAPNYSFIQWPHTATPFVEAEGFQLFYLPCFVQHYAWHACVRQCDRLHKIVVHNHWADCLYFVCEVSLKICIILAQFDPVVVLLTKIIRRKLMYRPNTKAYYIGEINNFFLHRGLPHRRYRLALKPRGLPHRRNI